MNIYLKLTKLFNKGRLRAVLSSGQAVVLHRVTIMSKYGDWILREDTEVMNYILTVLSKYNARYRFGAPLDISWMSGGWSSHFEFQYEGLRVRTDFVTRPPRISKTELKNLWQEQEGRDIPFVNVRQLAEMKKTNRERDYAVIGELARLMSSPGEELLYSRSARDMISIAEKEPHLVLELKAKRPLLEKISEGRDKLEVALDAERRNLIRANEERLKIYTEAARMWYKAWPNVEKEIIGCSLTEAHKIVVSRAKDILPFNLEER